MCPETAESALEQWQQGEGCTRGVFYWVFWTLVQTWAVFSNLPRAQLYLTTKRRLLPRQAVSLA